MRRSKPLHGSGQGALTPDLVGAGLTPSHDAQIAAQLYRMLQDAERENARLDRQLRSVEGQLLKAKRKLRQITTRHLVRKFYSNGFKPHEAGR